jgi:uncharacterized protein
MMPQLSPEEVFHRLVGGVCELVNGDASQADKLAELYAQRTRVEHPMAPLGVAPLLTREDLRRHFAAGPPPTGNMQNCRAENVRIHHTTDPEVIVAEFSYAGTSSGVPFTYACVFVIRVRDGEIVESRDYVNHLESARVRGRLSDLIDKLTATAPGGR